MLYAVAPVKELTSKGHHNKMIKSKEHGYIANVLVKSATAMAKPRSYAVFYLDAAREVHIYEAADIHKLKAVMDAKHPEFELVHIEGYPDSSAARNLAAAARQIREIRANVLSISEMYRPANAAATPPTAEQ
jgi:molybdopterin-guanine dinucleotide biosynthesis protein